MKKNKLLNICVVLLLCSAFSSAVKADGDVPIAGYQCNPALEICEPPPCLPGEYCPDNNLVNRAAPPPQTPATPSSDPTLIEDMLNALKKLLSNS